MDSAPRADDTDLDPDLPSPTEVEAGTDPPEEDARADDAGALPDLVGD